MNPAGIFKVVSEVCFSCGLFTLQVENEAMCIADSKLYTLLKFAHHLFWCLCSLPLIVGLYNCTDDWAPQTVWQATTTQHTEMSGSLNFTQFLILLWMIKEACPIITHEKLTQPSVWTNWGSFVCFAFSQSRNLMFSPLRLGSGFPIFWPVLPLAEVGDQWLAFGSTYDLPYPCSQQMLVQSLVCVLLTDCTDFRRNNAQ